MRLVCNLFNVSTSDVTPRVQEVEEEGNVQWKSREEVGCDGLLFLLPFVLRHWSLCCFAVHIVGMLSKRCHANNSESDDEKNPIRKDRREAKDE